MKYIFILGNNPELSVAEIKAVLPQAKVISTDRQFLVLESEKFNCQEILNRLGGTIKIGVVIGSKIDPGAVLGSAMTQDTGRRFNFGFSFYGQKPSSLGLKIKKTLKEKGISSRLVVSREPALSSVIVKKEKCHDFLVLPGYFGLTCAVQEFETYSELDYGRPASDALSGMLPPKLAKIMINLSGASAKDTLLDPFCGSGTILSQALAMGYKNLIGSDISAKAIEDTKINIAWLKENFQFSIPRLSSGQAFNFQLIQSDSRDLSRHINMKSIDAIITEPYLGPPIKGNERDDTIKKIIADVEDLYLSALAEFKKVLKADGRIVMVFPEWHLGEKIFCLHLFEKLTQMGYKRIDRNDLLYKRIDQKVWRKIVILKK